MNQAYNRYVRYVGILLAAILSVGIIACESLDDSIQDDPYGGGKEPLNIKLLPESPSPAEGYPKDTVVFKAKGLLAYCSPETREYEFKFYMSDMETEILTATDTTLTVVVPDNLTTGLTYLVLQNQVFYGPTFRVLGNVAVDENFQLSDDVRISGSINDFLETDVNSDTYFLAGAFSSAIGKNVVDGIMRMSSRGEVSSTNTTDFKTTEGLVSLSQASAGEEHYLNSIAAFSDGRLLIAGAFSAYQCTDNDKNNVLGLDNCVTANNIMILKPNAYPDTIQMRFNDYMDEKKGTPIPLGVSAFNGGSKQPVIRAFVTADDNVIAVGNLTQYCYNQYAPLYEESREMLLPVSMVMKMDKDGSLDEEYRPAGTHAGAEGGQVADAYMDEDEGVVIVGSFTSFDGIPAGGIVRLDKTGEVDRTFMGNIQGGADQEISSIRYNKSLGKAVMTGTFSSIGGKPRAGIAVIGKDGKIDEGFSPKEFEGGGPNFASIITGTAGNSKIIVSGTFTRYDKVVRQGFLMLDMDGAATQKFNVPGTFSGQLKQVIETTTTTGDYGLLLAGDFTRFNGKLVTDNLVMLEVNLGDN